MLILPITSDGARTITFTTAAGIMALRTYWNPAGNHWCADIADGAANPVATGLALVAGTTNLLAGIGPDPFAVYALEVRTAESDSERTADAWGSTALLVLREAGEIAQDTPPDAMLAPVLGPVTDWSFGMGPFGFGPFGGQ